MEFLALSTKKSWNNDIPGALCETNTQDSSQQGVVTGDENQHTAAAEISPSNMR